MIIPNSHSYASGILPSGHEARRSARCEYHVDATLEIVGRTSFGHGVAACVRDVSERGIGLHCTEAPGEGSEVLITLPAPDGRTMRVAGTVMHGFRLKPGWHHVGIAFDDAQPTFSLDCVEDAK